ncbi:MAG: hypothetical protein Q8P67_20505, partial [archaeon]|nr:hypothetical protein [archaeon]
MSDSSPPPITSPDRLSLSPFRRLQSTPMPVRKHIGTPAPFSSVLLLPHLMDSSRRPMGATAGVLAHSAPHTRELLSTKLPQEGLTDLKKKWNSCLDEIKGFSTAFQGWDARSFEGEEHGIFKSVKDKTAQLAGAVLIEPSPLISLLITEIQAALMLLSRPQSSGTRPKNSSPQPSSANSKAKSPSPQDPSALPPLKMILTQLLFSVNRLARLTGDLCYSSFRELSFNPITSPVNSSWYRTPLTEGKKEPLASSSATPLKATRKLVFDPSSQVAPDAPPSITDGSSPREEEPLTQPAGDVLRMSDMEAPEPLLVCRICELPVPAGIFLEHTGLCFDVVRIEQQKIKASNCNNNLEELTARFVTSMRGISHHRSLSSLLNKILAVFQKISKIGLTDLDAVETLEKSYSSLAPLITKLKSRAGSKEQFDGLLEIAGFILGASADKLDAFRFIIEKEFLLTHSSVVVPSRSFFNHEPSLNDFEILKPISKGGFSRVFLAKKMTTSDLFAIKVLKKHEQKIANVAAERDILTHINNPFVV